MTSYKHTQIGYLMLVVLLAVSALFALVYIAALNELPSYDSGPNLAVTFTMALIIFILGSFATLTVSVDEKYLKIKFGYGIFRKKFLISDIVSAKQVRNSWYYGWGIRFWLWPKMWIYNVSGFRAVEIVMRSGNIYRIGTDDPSGLETELGDARQLCYNLSSKAKNN